MSAAYQRGLMAKWIQLIRKSDHIKTWTGDGELAYIMEEATKANLIIEIGTWLGRSAKVMLDANPNTLLTCVDPGIVDFIFETAAYFLKDQIVSGHCSMIKKYSHEAAVDLSHLLGKIDMVWIDGNHAFEYVYQDLKTWIPFVRPGGLICGHDYETNPKNGVARAVEFVIMEPVMEPVPRVWAYRKPL